MSHSLRYAASCTFLFTEVPLNQRAAAAKAAGFDAVEFWWPFSQAVPPEREVEDFVSSIEDAGVQLIGLNLFGGDMAGADAGLVSIPSRKAEFTDNLAVAVAIGKRLGVSGLTALYGVRLENVSPEQQDELATQNLVIAARAASEIGATIQIEAVSGPKPYPLRTADDAVAVVDRVRAAGAPNIGFLCDMYHLANNGDDLDAAVAAHYSDIVHIQIADLPGRGEPGSGALDLDRHLSALQSHGYDGYVALEYNPTTSTEESLAWLPRQRRGDPSADADRSAR